MSAPVTDAALGRSALFCGLCNLSFARRTIDVPSIFIPGKSNCGVYQRPGAVDRMLDTARTRFVGCHLLDGAGHWVRQEQATRVSEFLLDFLKGQATRDSIPG